MKRTKRTRLILILSFAAALLLAGCSKGAKGTDTAKIRAKAEPLELRETFDSLLWGSYEYEGWTVPYSGDVSGFLKDMTFETLEVGGQSVQVSSVPLYFSYIGPYWNSPDNDTDPYDGTKAGLRRLHEEFRKEHEEQYWKNYVDYLNMNVVSGAFYYDGNQVVTFKSSLYKVNGNTLSICYDYDVDEDTYEIRENMSWMDYEFSFRGRDLLISRNNGQVTMQPENALWGDIMSGYASSEEDVYQGITRLLHTGSSAADIVYDAEHKYGDMNAKVELSPDGRIRIIRGDNTVEAQYLNCDKMGFILIADGICYLYQKTWNQFEEEQLGDVLGESEELEVLSENTVNELIKTKENILEDLSKAFQDAGIEADIDAVSGRVTMNSSILFDVDASDVSDSGKEYLDSFLQVYSSVLMSEKYNNVVSNILIEGHTDTSGTYEHNLVLSEARADAVSAYCVEKQPELSEIIRTKGCAYDDPVYDIDGNVDMNASRRVVFKFLLRVEEKYCPTL